MEQTLHPSVLSVQFRPCSNVFKLQNKFLQYYQLCIESSLGETGHSIYQIKEYEFIWPKDKKQLKNYQVHLRGMQIFKPKCKTNQEMFYPHLTENFRIDGTMLSLGLGHQDP